MPDTIQLKADGTPYNTRAPIEIGGKWFEVWMIFMIKTDQVAGSNYNYPIDVPIERVFQHRQHQVGLNTTSEAASYRPEGLGVFKNGDGSMISTGSRVAVNGEDSFVWSSTTLFYQ